MGLLDFMNLPQPTGDGEDERKAGGSGYQWIIDKFVKMGDDLRQLREAALYDEDKGDYRKFILNVAIAAGQTEGSKALVPVPVGTEYRIERISAASSTLTAMSVLLNDMANNGSFITALPQQAFAGLNSIFCEPNIILKEGEELSALVVAGAAGAQNVVITVWARVITEKPMAVAVA